MGAPPPTFELRGVSVRYAEQTALSEIGFRVQPGERVAIVGPSGAGKTTLLSLFNGTVRASAGTVVVEGRELASLSSQELRAQRTRIGFVPQEHGLVPNLRVSQNVLAGRLGHRGFWAAMRSMVFPAKSELEKVHGLLERVGIPEKLFQRTSTLSGGQRQRVAIARALYQQPAALVVDEPLASVDPARSLDLARLLCDVAEERGLSLVASLHDLEIAREFFPRLIGLRGGELVFDAPTAELSVGALDELYRLEGSRG